MLGDNIDGCTHIVVKGISRTVKFLSAIPLGAYFVTEDWVLDSIEAGQLLGKPGSQIPYGHDSSDLTFPYII